MVSIPRRIRRLLRGDLGELIRGASSFAIVQLCAMLVGIVYYVVLARMYGASAIGALSLSMTVANIFLLLGTVGCQRSATRFVAAVPKEQSSARRRVYRRGCRGSRSERKNFYLPCRCWPSGCRYSDSTR